MRESDAANRMAMAYVAVLVDADAADVDSNEATRVQTLVNDAIDNGEMTEADLLGALGLLGARAVEDLAKATGEPGSFWLQRWLAEPFG